MLLVRWLVCGILLLLAGCGQEPVRALKVATNQWIGYEPLYLARYIGAYQQNVDIIQLSSTTDVMRAMRNGNVDVMASTLDEALTLTSQGEDLVVLLAFDFSHGADVVLGRPPVTALEDIKGKRVGVENTGLGALMLSAALDSVGMQPSDVTIINLAPDQHEQAYREHKVDAIIAFEPVATRLQQAGAKRLYDSSAIPELIVDVLVARRSVLEQRSEALADLLLGYYSAREYMVLNQAAAYGFFGKRMKISPVELQSAFDRMYLPSLQDSIRWLSGSSSGFIVARDQLQALMRQRNLLDADAGGQLQSGVAWVKRVTQ